MLHIYDDAIIEDLISCIDPDHGLNNTVKVMGESGVMGVFAQLQEDKIKFPAIFLERDGDTPLDQDRYNFSRMHKGVAACIDSETNTLYIEKAIPVKLNYKLHCLTTNTIDMDELVRELLFRYSQMYYITTEIPYESKRKIRFGVAIKPDTSITKKSGLTEYIESGTLYESIIELECQGAVYISYTPRRMQRPVTELKVK